MSLLSYDDNTSLRPDGLDDYLTFYDNNTSYNYNDNQVIISIVDSDTSEIPTLLPSNEIRRVKYVIRNCPNIKSIENINYIFELNISDCHNLISISNIEQVSELQINNCNNLTVLSDISCCVINITNCKSLDIINNIYIYQLEINNCNHKANITNIINIDIMYFYPSNNIQDDCLKIIFNDDIVDNDDFIDISLNVLYHIITLKNNFDSIDYDPDYTTISINNSIRFIRIYNDVLKCIKLLNKSLYFRKTNKFIRLCRSAEFNQHYYYPVLNATDDSYLGMGFRHEFNKMIRDSIIYDQ
jgi:hypothetical protein